MQPEKEKHQFQPPTETDFTPSTETSFTLPKNKRSKKPLFIVLIIVLIVAATAGGWWYGKKQAQNDAKTQADSLNQQISDLKKEKADAQNKLAALESNQNTTTEQSDADFLVVKEWGIKFPLTDTLNDLEYSIKGDNLAVTSKSFVAKYGADCGVDQIAPGQVSRGTATDIANNGTPLKDAPGAVKIGSYYYLYVHPQSLCGNGDASQTEVVDALKAILSKPEAS